jgi:hypothetical protein
MSRRVRYATGVLFVAFVAAQLVRPERANPATDVTRSIQGVLGAGSGVAAVVNRACRDCHTNATVWPAYTQIAPVSWLMAYAVNEGRRTVNFSEWATYSREQQRILLAVSCDDVTSGKMPGAYTWLRPETRLSVKDVETICSAARQAQAPGAF